MSTFTQIKQIHTLKNIIGLDDERYRKMLSSFDVYSSKSLTYTEAQLFIEILSDEAKQIAKRKLKYDEFNGRDVKMASPLQLRKIEYMWAEIRTEKTKAKSLEEFLQTQFHVDGIRFMTKAKASRIIAVMEKIKLNQCLKVI